MRQNTGQETHPQKGSLLELSRRITFRLELAEGAHEQGIGGPGLQASQVEQHWPAQPELAVQGIRSALHHVLGHRRLHARVQHHDDNPCRAGKGAAGQLWATNGIEHVSKQRAQAQPSPLWMLDDAM